MKSVTRTLQALMVALITGEGNVSRKRQKLKQQIRKDNLALRVQMGVAKELGIHLSERLNQEVTMDELLIWFRGRG